jgi:hypothetical protein
VSGHAMSIYVLTGGKHSDLYVQCSRDTSTAEVERGIDNNMSTQRSKRSTAQRNTNKELRFGI